MYDHRMFVLFQSVYKQCSDRTGIQLSKSEQTVLFRNTKDRLSAVEAPINGKIYKHCRCRSWQRCQQHEICMCYATTRTVAACGVCDDAMISGTAKRGEVDREIQNVMTDSVMAALKKC